MARPAPSPLAAEPPPEPWARRLAILAGYLLLGVAFTWPLAPQFGAGAIQVGALPVDAGQGIWNLWWARSALLGGANPFVTGHLFYPSSLNLLYQTLSLPNALSVWPVLALAGPVPAFNTIIALSFGLGGYWAYRLGRAVGASAGAALLAGFVYAFTPYHIQRVWGGTMELASTHWLALYALLLLRALARRTPASVAAAGLALFVTTLASQYHGLYAAVYTAAHGLLAAALAPRGARLRTLAAGAGVGAVWAAPLLTAALLAGGVGGVALEDWYERQVFHSVALVDLLAPNVRHPLWGEAAAAWQRGLHPFGLESGAGLGVGVAALCGLALWRRRSAAWPWAALALLCLLLAMGPQLRLTAAPSPAPGPFLLLDLLDIFRNSSRPAIFIAHMLTPVAALVALGLDAAAGLAPRPRRRVAPDRSAEAPADRQGSAPSALRSPLAAGLAALVILESLVAPWPIMAMRAAPGGAALNADPEPGAVLELPPRLNDSRALLRQICHGRPLMGGYLARLPPYPIASFPSATRALWLAEPPAPDIVALRPAAELASLGVRFVALDLTELPRGDRAAIGRWLDAPGISLASAGEAREVYAVDPAAAAPAAVLGPGWHDVESDGARVWRWMGGRAELGLLARAPAAVELSLRATAYGGPRPLEVRQGETLLARVEVPAAPLDRALALRLLLPPGATAVTLASPAEQGPDGRSLSLSVSDVRVRALPVDAGWAAQGSLAIPATIPAIGAAPCR